jgi:hypothetical protein
MDGIISFLEDSISPRKEIEMDLNLNNSCNFFSNVNEIVIGVYISKKSSLQLLNEIENINKNSLFCNCVKTDYNKNIIKSKEFKKHLTRIEIDTKN